MDVTRREFLHSAGAMALLATVEAGALLAGPRKGPNRVQVAGPASVRVLRGGNKWVAMHHKPTGEVLACVRNYGV